MHVGSPGFVTKIYPYPGYCATVLQKSKKFRVRYGGLTEFTKVPGTVRTCYRTHRSSGYCGTGVQNSNNI